MGEEETKITTYSPYQCNRPIIPEGGGVAKSKKRCKKPRRRTTRSVIGLPVEERRDKGPRRRGWMGGAGGGVLPERGTIVSHQLGPG